MLTWPNSRFAVLLALSAFSTSGIAPFPPPGRALAASWSRISADSETVGRYAAVAVFDSRRERFLMATGVYTTVCIGGQSWISYPSAMLTHDLAADVPWLDHATTDAPQLDRAAAIYDSLGDRLWLFGGEFMSSGAPAVPSNATCSLDPASGAWSSFAATGTPPPPVTLPQLVLDPGARRLLAFGGMEADGTAAPGVYAMSLAIPGAWQALAPSGTPPAPRWGACAAYDPDSNRVVVVAGALDQGQPASDVWALDLAGASQWRAIPTTGPPPSGRCWGALDRASGQLIVFTGDTTVVYALDLGTRTWSVLPATGSVPMVYSLRAWDWAASAFDTSHRRFVYAWPDMFSRFCLGPMDAFTYVLDLLPNVSVPPDRARAPLELSPAIPNPARLEFALRATLPDDGPAEIRVFDLAGRSLWSTTLSGAGEHTVRIGTMPLPAGLLFVRLSCAGRSASRRVAVLPF